MRRKCRHVLMLILGAPMPVASLPDLAVVLCLVAPEMVPDTWLSAAPQDSATAARTSFARYDWPIMQPEPGDLSDHPAMQPSRRRGRESDPGRGPLEACPGTIGYRAAEVQPDSGSRLARRGSG